MICHQVLKTLISVYVLFSLLDLLSKNDKILRLYTEVINITYVLYWKNTKVELFAIIIIFNFINLSSQFLFQKPINSTILNRICIKLVQFIFYNSPVELHIYLIFCFSKYFDNNKKKKNVITFFFFILLNFDLIELMRYFKSTFLNQFNRNQS